MSDLLDVKVNEFMAKVIARNPGESEFHQAVKEVVESLMPLSKKTRSTSMPRSWKGWQNPKGPSCFRVPWVDDNGEIHINKGIPHWKWTVAIGPYKGGIRFHPTVNLGILKFLAFEQVFKNSLTTLPMGGGKGGSDFDPKGKSDQEVMRFCQSFMTELNAI